mmetsp:Transcript_92305/g.266431  ORF Transcript_92305/g.266431 Transcript_92305/m.266431 type:complete len:252 (+) Transcript_92305:588-1343(+)
MRRVFSYSACRAWRSSAAFSWRTRRCSSWYLRYSRSCSRKASRNSDRSLTFSAICLPMASRCSMICGRSPSCSLRPSMSADICSCTFRLPSRKRAISSLIAPMDSLKLAPESREAKPASKFLTWDTFGRFFFSSAISFMRSFSSFKLIVSVTSLNSISAMRWSISSSEVKPIDFFILFNWLRISVPSCRFSPMALLISVFLSINLSIFAENSSNCARNSAFFAKNSSLPPERSAIFFARSACCFCNASIPS